MRVLTSSRHFAVACLVAIVVLLADQVTKAIALTYLERSERISLAGDFFGLQLSFNPGAAFSIGTQITWAFTLLSLAATVVLFVVAMKVSSRGLALGIGLIWGGAMGNLADRLFAPPAFGQGHVTDFLAYGSWFIGNVADIALTVGVVLVLFVLWRAERTAKATP